VSTSQPIQQRSLRQHNLAVVARTVVDAAGPLSRAGVAAATGLTRGTVSALVDRLLAAGILIELPPVRQVRAGRPAVPLAPARRTIVGLGLEVNVDYLGARIVDLTGDTVDEIVVPGDFHGSDPGATLARLGGLARDLVDRAATAGLRVAWWRRSRRGCGSRPTSAGPTWNRDG
jgi:hypothetical protein